RWFCPARLIAPLIVCTPSGFPLVQPRNPLWPVSPQLLLFLILSLIRDPCAAALSSGLHQASPICRASPLQAAPTPSCNGEHLSIPAWQLTEPRHNGHVQRPPLCPLSPPPKAQRNTPDLLPPATHCSGSYSIGCEVALSVPPHRARARFRRVL